MFKNRLLTASAMVGAVMMMSATSANATTGMFSAGYGVINKGMAGTGTALVQDTQSVMRNPAAMVHLGNRVDAGLTWFSPRRDVAFGGGTFESGSENFFIPDVGVNYMLDDYSSLSLVMSANGGMNTDYNNPALVGFFGAANPGIDLAQAFINMTYSLELDPHNSIGVTPVLAVQRFKARGLAAFAATPPSSSPTNVTGNKYDYSYGAGLRVG